MLKFRRNSWFCDLFVRVSNRVAYDMYTKCGYTVFRRVLDYYSGENDEDAYGKQKILQNFFLFSITKVFAFLFLLKT
jgi:ribosomal protein S18 acetylase RimI-like enzyme